MTLVYTIQLVKTIPKPRSVSEECGTTPILTLSHSIGQGSSPVLTVLATPTTFKIQCSGMMHPERLVSNV
jgi:hypothetical protein